MVFDLACDWIEMSRLSELRNLVVLAKAAAAGLYAVEVENVNR